MLASCKSKSGFERQYVDEKGEQPPGKEVYEMGSAWWERRVNRRGWMSAER